MQANHEHDGPRNPVELASEKKAYHSPTLTAHGAVPEQTAASGGGAGNDGGLYS